MTHQEPLHIIGHVASDFTEKFGTPRQSLLVHEPKGVIHLEKEYSGDCLIGLEEFSHIWVLFWFHQNGRKEFRPKVIPPRYGKKIGVFATRSPHRPNPVGLSVVKLDKIEADAIYISGLDIIDGTPVIDIKPYIPIYDSWPDAKSGWLESTPQVKWPVEMTDEFLQKTKEVFDVEDEAYFLSLFSNTVAQDPRPLVYRRPPHNEYDHALTVSGYNIHFRFQKDHFVLFKIELSQPT